MRQITIYRQFFTKSDCYKKGIIQTPQGIQVHSTGANNSYLHRYVGPDDGYLGPNKYNNTHNQPGLDVCANAYIGRLNDGTPAIYQTLPWDMRCWLSANGKNGNANNLGFIGFEICEDNRHNREYFNQVVLNLSVNLCAYLCQEYNIPVENVLDHKELHARGLASNHGDIDWWLVNFGYNMTKYREEIKKAIAEGVRVTYIDSKNEVEKPMYTAIVTANSGNSVNMRAGTSSTANIIARIPLGSSVEVLKEVNSDWSEIRYNGQTGYMMAKFLQKQAVSSVSNKDDLLKIKSKLAEAIEIIDKLLK